MRIIKTTLIYFFICLFAAGCILKQKQTPDTTGFLLADSLFQAYKTHKNFPILSEKYPDIDVKKAYYIQKKFVEKRLQKDKIAGFKAGLTSKKGQDKFNVSKPLAGVLFDSGKTESSVVIDRSKFKKLMIETEIGFEISKDINKPIKDTVQLKKYIKSVMPVIELPDIVFPDIKKAKGVDLIITNVLSSHFITGKRKSSCFADLNNLEVSLNLKNRRLYEGKGSDAMNDQWKAALWLVNTMVEQGYTIKKSNIIITGSLGKMIPAKPGKYYALYGKLGRIIFEIK